MTKKESRGGRVEMRIGICRQLCFLLMSLRRPDLGIAQAISRQTSPTWIFQAGLNLALVRHIPKALGFCRCEVQLDSLCQFSSSSKKKVLLRSPISGITHINLNSHGV